SGRNTDMIFNWAFLLSKENIESFLCRIKQLENIYSKQGIILEITGEWPPYSFCFPLADL
ncbi:MAG: GvpL/GvpF family gas vesicle protein, partial [Candidatus Delongbacteria bacterium]|nr:GvpL/GvpF family gas vesicle protein [Candidatus Delongbacteria bacterium]